jgi:hypothetical protein
LLVRLSAAQFGQYHNWHDTAEAERNKKETALADASAVSGV